MMVRGSALSSNPDLGLSCEQTQPVILVKFPRGLPKLDDGRRSTRPLPTLLDRPPWSFRVYFFDRLLEAVILLVVIRSPIYFCKNLLLLSSLWCSSLTASIRLKSVMRESCNAFACLYAHSSAFTDDACRQGRVLDGNCVATVW